MPRTAAEYREQLKALLPPGIAFPREPGTRLEDLLDGMAQELARIDARGERLIIEANPLSTSELLVDWERVAGLPDNCTGRLEATLQGRRQALISKLSATGGQSPAYFIDVARGLGFDITISEFRPFRAGRSRAGDPLTNGDWVHTWRVNAHATTIIEFRAGLSAAGEPLRSWGNDILECKINELKPAHTIVLYGYGYGITLSVSDATLTDDSLPELSVGDATLIDDNVPELSVSDATLTDDSLPELSVSDATVDDPEPEEPVAPGALMTSGAQILNVASDTPVQLKSVNWFGAEGTNYTPHGTWARRYTDILDQVASWGFNCLRIPFSGDIVDATPPTTAFDADLNPEFVGLSALDILDLIVDYAGSLGLYVVLDHHRRHAGNGADGAPTDAGYSEAAWHATWTAMAQRYGSAANVVGADLHNEPHELTWDAWATMAEACGNAIHAVAPHWLIMVEGVGAIGDDHYWWGGQLAGVATRPVVLAQTNRLVYSPHEYGQSVGSQNWLAYDGQTPPANWPLNLYGVWHDHWGFIAEQGIAPIWIGEFGGHYGLDGSGNLTKPHAAYETQWTQELVKYLGGDFDGDGQRDLPSSQTGLSFAYWSLNPNSGDTGGLLQDDWTTPQQPKLALLEPLLTAPTPTPGDALVDDDNEPLVDDDNTPLEDD